jgi:type I restriction enzyme S subunit
VRLYAYSKYKASGVDWLGDVPDHWAIKALKREVSRSVSGGGLIKGNMANEPADDLFKGFSASGQDVWVDEAHYDMPGVVLSAVGARCGKAFKADGQWTAVANTHVFFPRAGHSRDYLWYLLNNEEFWEKGGTAQPYVRVPATLNRSFVFPPPNEQRAIADFLDRETGKIDMLVGKKRELIEKLKEKRTALISRTVTRGLSAEAAAKAGLNPHPKLKASGIERLGDIPEHWELVQLRRRITLQRGVDTTKDEQNEGDVPVVSSGGISSYHDHALVRGPGVVVGRKGTAGAVYYIEEDFWPHDTTLYVKEYRASNPRYVYYKLLSMNLQSYDTGSANPTVNRNIVHPEIVSWPSPTEQRAVVDYLDHETAKIDRMMEKVEAAIEKLHEYRTALITAAVTGKIDVRNSTDSAVSTPGPATSTLPA